MTITRRDMMATTLAASAIAVAPALAKEPKPMFGLNGQMIAVSGKRDELVRYLLEASTAMPGCLSYIVALDTTNPDAIWVTEVWDSGESHKASLALPQVRTAITKARPIIAGFGSQTETIPVGGTGIKR